MRDGGEGSEGANVSTSIQSLGGKARAASMTPEERTKAARHAATKGARKLGREGRRLRALKGAATRKARAIAADTLQIKGYLPTPCPVGEASLALEACGTCGGSGASPGGLPCLGCEGTGSPEYLKVEPVAKPKRPLPKAGTMSAKVLDVVRLKGPLLLDAIEYWVVPAAPRFEVRNALSSLRSAGHVESVPKPGSRREKLWRLA